MVWDKNASEVSAKNELRAGAVSAVNHVAANRTEPAGGPPECQRGLRDCAARVPAFGAGIHSVAGGDSRLAIQPAAEHADIAHGRFVWGLSAHGFFV